MSKGFSGLFNATTGCKNNSQLSINTANIDANLPLVTPKYPLNSYGNFGEKGKNVRVIKSSNPIATSQDFYSKIISGAKLEILANGKGTKATFPDGTIVVHRINTSTPNSPAVSINIKSNNSKIKSQKFTLSRKELQMIDTTFSKQEISLLHNIINHSIQAITSTEPDAWNYIYGNVCLKLDNIILELNNEEETIPFYDGQEDIALFKLKQLSPAETFYPLVINSLSSLLGLTKKLKNYYCRRWNHY